MSRRSRPGLADVLDRVLDKGIVIDAAVRVSVAGVELLGVDARVVVASIETYLLHADTLASTDMVAAPPREIADSVHQPEIAGSMPLRAVADSTPPPPSALYAEETKAAESAPDRVRPPEPPINESPSVEDSRAAGQGPEPVEDG